MFLPRNLLAREGGAVIETRYQRDLKPEGRPGPGFARDADLAGHGVTVQEPGISKLVGVKFDPRTAAAPRATSPEAAVATV